ncbi:MAG: phage portal protein [Sphaerobacter sp.]|nr:phage portal protein [Sphaerobacter sp.]
MGLREAWKALFAVREGGIAHAPGAPMGAMLPGDGTTSMGPGRPPEPQPLGGEPRRWVYRPGWNLPTVPGEGRRIDYDTLRRLADTYELARRCIEIRKHEVQGLEWDIVPATSDRRKSREIQEREGDLIDEIRRFFLYPADAVIRDGKRVGYTSFDEWIGALLEDYFVLDALTVYPRTTLGGRLLSLDPIDGATIKVLLDDSGRIPLPPAPAYQQYLYGIARADFTRDELYYYPRLVRTHTPYGFSHIEQILMHVNLALRNEMWNTAYFTEGNLPPMVMEAPEGYTADQLRELNDWWDQVMSGDPGALRKLKFVPAGSKPIVLKEFEFGEEFARWLAELTCMYFDVQPVEVGFTPRSGLGGKGFSEGQEAITVRKSLRPLTEWLATLFTRIIHQWWGAYDLRFSFVGVERIDEKLKNESDKIAIEAGIKTLDQVREERGDEPYGVNGPIFVAGTQVLGLADLKALTSGEAPAPKPGPPGPPGQPPPEGEAGNRPKPPMTAGPEARKAAVPTGEAAQELLDDPGDAADLSETEREQVAADRPTHAEEAAFVAAFLRWWKAHVRNGRLPAQAEQAQHLAEQLYRLKTEAYRTAINRMLKQLGIPEVERIRDVQVLERLREEAHRAAVQIAKTQQHDFERQRRKLVADGLQGDELHQALQTWADQRAAWKAKQIAMTESNGPYKQAVVDFSERNRLTGLLYRVAPDECVCAYCQSLVDGNPHTLDEVREMRLPAHPNCWHEVIPEFGDDLTLENPWTGA